MTMRRRILMGLNALLYIGPLLAGLAGQGWNMIPLFSMIFLLWLAVIQPGDWPHGRDEWRQRDRQLSVVTQSLVHVLLVVVLFAVGRGLGGILGVVPLFHPMLPVALSFLAVPMARLAGSIPVPAVKDEAATNQRLQAAVRVTETLNALPHDVDHAVIDAHMKAIAAEIGAEDLREALIARVKGGEASTTTVRALVNLASSASWATGLDQAAAERVFAAFAGNGQQAMHFATAMNSHVSSKPELAHHCPSPATLIARADALKGTDAEVPLRSLASRVARVTEVAAPAAEEPLAAPKAAQSAA
jgi:hypothetical protein